MVLTLTIQGWYFVLTGIWPLIHMKSFEAVTGYKKEKWLLRTVSLLILSSGFIFIKFPSSEVSRELAILNALFLASIDIYYSLKNEIRKIYLADAVIELGFVGMLLSFEG